MSADDRGAVSLEAMDRVRFEVINFVPERVIREKPWTLGEVFPGLVRDRILERLRP